MKIVVVDDEEGVRRSLKKVLEKDRNEIYLAEDGSMALEYVRENGQDVETVISDFKMPGMDGLETLIAIGEINADITRILLTGYATMDSAIEAVNVGIDGFLTKPFDNQELRAKVREYNIKKRLKQFISEPVFQALLKENGLLQPRRLQASILFVDIRDFSRMASQMEPGELADMMNRHYFNPLDQIVYDSGGTLDKHIGDGIMALFGAPISYEDDALRAVRCAVRMLEETKRINDDLRGAGGAFSIGIGIATGDVMAGLFGSSRKKEYTVFGNPVNLASRLEHLALGGQIIVCDETRRLVGDTVQGERMTPVTVKGLEKPVEPYHILGLKETC